VVTPEIPNMWNERDLRLLQLISTSTGRWASPLLPYWQRTSCFG